MRSLTTLAVLLAISSLGRAGSTWHVDQDGTPPGSGTPADPYPSIQAAIAAASTVHGDTLLVAPGSYVENVSYAGKELAIVAAAGPLATEIVAAGPGPVVFSDAPHLTNFAKLVGFTVRGAQGSAPGIRVDLESNAILTVERCIVRDNGGPGIQVDYDCFVYRSTLVGNARGFSVGQFGLLHMLSSITWDNALPNGISFAFYHLLAYNNFEDLALGGQPCTDCISQDPRFWDSSARDLALRADSPSIDAGNPAAAPDPDGSVVDQGALTFDPAYAPGTARYCFGSDSACPCANGGSGDAGCDLPQASGGIALVLRDFLPDGAGSGGAKLIGTGFPPAASPAVVLIRSPAAESPPVAFGDGLRCIAASGLVRIGGLLATGGASLHVLSHGAGAGTFFYQLWARSTPSAFCVPEAFNLSNGLEITWP